MFQSLCRSNSSFRMPVSLSEWRVRIGTYVPRTPVIKTLDDDWESKVDSSEKKMGPTAKTDHQTSTDKTPSKPDKDDSSYRENNEQKTQTAADQNLGTPLKESKKRKRHNQKGSSRCGQYSGAFLSFRCFLKSGASPLLRFLLLVFTAILLVRSGDVEVNPGPKEEGRSTSVSDSTLLDIAKRIPEDKMYDLGNNLGIDFSDVRRHVAGNTRGCAVTFDGTLHMLSDWRDNTPIQQQGNLLRNALNTSSLQAVAEQYLHVTEDPPSREDASSEVQNVPIHHAPNAGQSTYLGRPNMASSTPFHPVIIQNQFQNPPGSPSTSGSFQESQNPNASGIRPINLSSGQESLYGMTSAQPYPLTGAGAHPVTSQPGTPNRASRMLSGDPYVSALSRYQTPQEPSMSRLITASDVHPACEIPPITDAQLEQCREDIKAFYDINLCQIPTSPLDTDSLVELKCIFTNLVLLEVNRSTKKKENLAYEDLLDIKINNQTAKRIMIQGEAGVGKTTFCAKIAWDWIEGNLYQDYALVAIVPLRDSKDGKTVGQVLKTYLSEENKVTSEQLDKYIKENQDKVLTVFDGFDEFGAEMSNESNPIVQILNCKELKSGIVIVTTRPWKAHEIVDGMSLKKQYAFVRIEGFKRKDVQTYVTKFYRDDKISAQSLLEFMEEGSLITETMAPFPIFCAMLCHMWKKEERREVICKLQTFSQVFQEMIVFLKEHYVSKQPAPVNNDFLNEVENKIEAHFKNISKIAFDGLLNNQLSFQEQSFESCARDLHVACEVGLLTKEKMSKRPHGGMRKMARLESTVSFPHKLFQEYTAGVYLHYLYSSKYELFDRLMKCIMEKNREFKYLLYFTGSFDENICKDILQRLIKKKVDLDFIVEVAYEGHSEEAALVIEEMQQKEQRSVIIKKGTSLHAIAGYMFTLKNLESLWIGRIPQGNILSRNLAEKVCSLKMLKELKLVGCNVPISFSDNLLQHAKDMLVETFILDEVKLTKNSAINMAKCICLLPDLKKCQLTTISSGDDFCTVFSSQASSSKIESLELGVEDIDESASQSLGAGVCAMPSLKNLKLYVSWKLSDGFYSTLKEGASSLKIESLELRDIYESASQSLGASVCAMPSLKNLKLLVSEKLCDGFCSTLKERASSLKVETLDLHHSSDINAVGEPTVQNLVASICAMPCLKNVKLSMELSDGFCIAFREGASSLKVETLDLNVGAISEHGLQSLGAGICSMPCLRSVTVYGDIREGKLKATLLKDVHMGESSSSSEVITSTCQMDITLKEELLVAFVSLLASSQTSKVESLELAGIGEAASQYLGASICAMPCLKNVKLSGNLSDEFFSALRERASSLKVESLELRGISEAASQYLGASICAMPCLKNVKLSGNLSSDEFFTVFQERVSSLKVNRLHLMEVALHSSHLSTIALMTKLTSLTLFEVSIYDYSELYEEEESRGLDHTPSSTSLTELNVDHNSFISLHSISLLERFPHIQKLTLAFHGDRTPFPEHLLHHVTMPTVTDLSLYGYFDYPGDAVVLTSLSLVPFPNLINLSLININIVTVKCTSILKSMRRKETLKTISIKDCNTNADFDALCEEINSEGKITVNVEHGELTILPLEELFKIL